MISGRELLWKCLGKSCAQAMSVAGYQAHLSILIFHSVAQAPDPLGHSDTTAEGFERTVRLLKSAFNVMSLGDAVQHLKDRTLPPRSACITFDDGYEDNYTVALPILRRHVVPATFFIASSYLDGGRMFNDAVIETVRRCATDSLDLRELGMQVYDLSDVQHKVAAVAGILDVVKPMPLDAREEAVASIARAAGVELRSNLMMSREQLALLGDAGMEIGAHTHRHPILSSLSDDDVREELSTSKRELEGIANKPVRLFAYPNGRPGKDYLAKHTAMVQEAGFDAALSTARGAATYGADLFQLPRFTPWEQMPEKIIARLMLNWRTDYSLAH